MILPSKYFWIPTYEQRYAMKIADPGDQLTNAVYSFVTPGVWGRPTAIKTHPLEAGLTVYLSRNGSKERRRVRDLKKMIETGKEYQRCMSAARATLKDVDVNNGWINVSAASPEVNPQLAGWIIGSVRDAGLSCALTPKVHDTEASAYREAERLATVTPGIEYIVLKTVRSVIAGGIKITNL